MGWTLNASLLLAACTATVSEPMGQDTKTSKTLPTETAERKYAECPGGAKLSQATNVSWEERPSHLSDHRSLRARLNSAMPEGDTRILFWSSGKHHTSVTFSVVAVRDAQGTWRSSGVGEEGPGLLSIEPHPMQVLDRELTAEQSSALDQALADPCLYASPRFQRDPNIASGGADQTIEIESPSGRWVASWFGARTPQIESIIELIAK
jgi:hypothetical protein